jgi:hypothetical protein
MNFVLRPQQPVPVSSTGHLGLAVAIALVLLLGALITPWGMVKSHGSAAVSALHHGDSWDADHGHSHDDDTPTSGNAHVHHAGDHSHDHAHALPLGLPGLSQGTALWQDRPVHAGPWPSLDGLERPPRA